MTRVNERRTIDEVELVGGPPTDGKKVIDYIFQLTEEAAKPLKLHYNCKKMMHETPGPSGDTNDDSFDACFKRNPANYAASEPQLKIAAYQHGEIARLIQLMLDPQSTEVSLKAYEAAGAAVRKLCTVNCAGALGSWCSWP